MEHERTLLISRHNRKIERALIETRQEKKSSCPPKEERRKRKAHTFSLLCRMCAIDPWEQDCAVWHQSRAKHKPCLFSRHPHTLGDAFAKERDQHYRKKKKSSRLGFRDDQSKANGLSRQCLSEAMEPCHCRASGTARSIEDEILFGRTERCRSGQQPKWKRQGKPNSKVQSIQSTTKYIDDQQREGRGGGHIAHNLLLCRELRSLRCPSGAVNQLHHPPRHPHPTPPPPVARTARVPLTFVTLLGFGFTEASSKVLINLILANSQRAYGLDTTCR